MQSITLRRVAVSCVLFLLPACVQSQFSNTSFSSLGFTRNVFSLGLGDQGAALPYSVGAFQFNPAALARAVRPQIEFHRFPLYVFNDQFQFSTFSATIPLPDVGSVGLEYTNLSYGELFVTTAQSPDGTTRVKSYERSFAATIARDLSDEFALGLQLRYAMLRMFAEADKLFISAGFQYRPSALDRRLTLGLSLMEFGTAVSYTLPSESGIPEGTISPDPPPSSLIVGVYGEALKSEHLSVGIGMEMSKPFDKRGENYEGVSSLRNLFSDWSDFPEDATIHTGLAFAWDPLSLGAGWEFFQQFAIGTESMGPKTGRYDVLTHSLKVGVGYEGFVLSAGYGSHWHNVHAIGFLASTLPEETFDFALSVKPDLFFADGTPAQPASLRSVHLSAGIGQGIRHGRYRSETFGSSWPFTQTHENSLVFRVDAAFYLSERSALVSGFRYTSIPFRVESAQFIPGLPPLIDTKIETFMLSSSYRWHPLELLAPLFVQGGIGICRFNVVSDEVYPRYSYQTYWTGALGATIGLLPSVFVVPTVEYRMILLRGGHSAPNLTGNSELDVSLNVGYEFGLNL